MNIVWSKEANFTFNQEIDFIFKKWNLKEVEKFINLVEVILDNLKNGVLLGKLTTHPSIKSFVISKQTTLFFSINNTSKTIELLLFWNNLQNPKKLKTALKNL